MKKLKILLTTTALIAVFCMCEAQSPIAAWTFDENTGTSTTDVVGSVTGTFMGSATWSDDAVRGTSVLLNGTTDYVEMDSATITDQLRQADNFAITAFFKTNHLVSEQQHIVWIGNTAGNGWGPESEINITIGHFNTAFGAPVLSFYFGSGDVTDKDQIHIVVQNPPGLDSTSWHHIAAVVSNANSAQAFGEFYLDGTLLTPMTTDQTGYAQADMADSLIDRTSWNSGILVGVGGNKSQRFFDGRIDNVKVYTDYLNAAAVNSDQLSSAKQVFQDNGDLIFPNPVKDNIVYLKNYENVISAELMYMDGTLVKTFDIQSSAINLSGITSGVYLLKVNGNNNESTMQKIIKL